MIDFNILGWLIICVEPLLDSLISWIQKHLLLKGKLGNLEFLVFNGELLKLLQYRKNINLNVRKQNILYLVLV